MRFVTRNPRVPHGKPIQEREGWVMQNPLAKVWIHAVWSTQDRLPLLRGEFKGEMVSHIRRKIEQMGCTIKIVNGTADHLHALFALDSEKTLAEVMRTVKGESANWFNRQNYLQGRFAWQTGYGGFSVSPQMVRSVEMYIRRQEEHHKRMTFWEEYERFIKMAGVPAGMEPAETASGPSLQPSGNDNIRFF
jgi:putative transposase